MSYEEWFNNHATKHKKIVKKLTACGFDLNQIIQYFDFENMMEKENDFCLLYAQNKRCHEIESLNCYLCACPYFRFNDQGIEKIETKTKYSHCFIDSKEGKVGIYGDAIHQDCSMCTIPHAKHYVENSFDLDWKKIMKKCNITTSK